jgi:hypothetical protein
MKAIFIFIFFFTVTIANAQWSAIPSVNNAVCNYTGNQMNVQVVSDGAGGAICTWVDTRNGGTQDIYAQRIDANGSLQWNADGVAICNALSDQYTPKLVTDGAGGAIIAWYDNRAGNYDMYAQRINANGVVQWATDGVVVCNATGNQNAHQLIADGSDGAIIVWSDGRSGGSNADIMAQRIDASGNVLWTSNGAPVCTATSLQNTPQLVSDGAGGAIISWEDWRNYSQPDIYAQRISSNGFTNWTFNGVAICTEPNFANQYSTKIAADGAGGAIICWLDQRNFGSGQDIYVQKINSSGSVQWAWDGVAVCTANFLQTAQQMIPDGAGGAIIIWEDRRTERDIYAQHFNSAGATQWTSDGISICNAAGTQMDPQLITRLSGGATILWTDLRNSSQEDIYAQAITAAGAELWPANGIPAANEAHSQSAAQLVSDAANGAIIAWQDLRTTTDYDIYSSRLFASGTLPIELITFTATMQNKNALLKWKTAGESNTSKYNLQRSVDGISFSTINTVSSNALNVYSYTDNTINNLNADNIYYRLQMTDNNGKSAYSKIVAINTSTGQLLTVMPNPAQNYIVVSSREKIKSISITSSNGHIVKSFSSNKLSRKQLDISELPAGIYFIKALGENQGWTKQFIKQ